MKTCRKALAMALIALCMLMFFNAAEAATLKLPSATQVVMDEAFMGDTSLDEVIIPEGCTSIGTRAFANCRINKITLPSTLAYIAPTAFNGNSGMKVVAVSGTYAYDWAIDNGFEVMIGAVSNLRATVFNKDITLSWSAMDGVNGYRISEKTSNSTTIIESVSNQTYYELSDVSVGSHTYIVEPYCISGNTTSYGSSAQVNVTISNILVESITLNNLYIELDAGESITLKATALPSNADNRSITWSSNNTNVATVTTSGKVTALSSGTATITATAKDGSGVKSSCVVDVNIDEPYLTVTHPTIGNVLSAGEIEMFNGEAHQTWTLNSNYPVRIETVGDWFYDNGLNTFEAGQHTYIIYMDDGAPVGTKRTGKVKFYINNSLFVTVNICQDGGESEPIVIDPSISVNHPVLGDIFEAGTFEMWNGSAYQTWTVTANCDWTITKSGSWFTVDRTSGSAGTTTLKITMADGAAAGETRNGSVTFKVNGKTYKTVNFKQVGPQKALTVTHALLGDIFDASPVQMFNGNAFQTWTIESNAAWTLTKTGTWFTVDKTSGNAGTTTVKLNFPDGADPGETREGTLKFYFDGALYGTVKIYQDGGEEEPDTDPSTSISITHPLIGNVIDASPIMMHNGSATQTWTVNANFNWKITTTGDTWFSVSPTSGSAGTTKVTITITDYTTSSNSGSIIFKKGSTKKATINIQQGGEVSYDDSFSVSHPDLGDILEQDTIYMYNGYSHQTWTVMSNVDWYIDTYDDDWFTVSPTSGSANTASNQYTNVVLSFADGAAPGETRTGRIRFTYYLNGSRKRTNVYIAQYGGPSGGGTEVTNDPSLAASHALLGDVFEASPIEMHNGAAEQNWTITSNTKWTISTTGSWFTVSPTSGSANTESNPTTNLKISMSSGVAAGSRREGSITFYLNGTKYRTVNFYQDGGQAADPSMTIGSADFGDVLTLDTIPLESTKKTYSFMVKANRAWSVTKSGSWFTITPTSGDADTQYTFKVTVNTLPAQGQELTGSLTFKVNGTTYKTVNLKIANSETVVVDPTDNKLPAPTNLAATVTGTTSATLTWNNVSGASGFNVYRSTTITGTFTKLNSSLVKTQSYTDSTLVSGVNYYYYVAAVSSSNVIGSGSTPVGPVSFNAACSLSTGDASWSPSASGVSKNFTITKHGSNDYTVSIVQYNSAGTQCTGKTTSTDHTLANWLTYTKSGTTLTLTAAKNYAATGKTAIVSVKCGCGATHTITVNQSSGENAPASVSMQLDGYNGFTESSTVKGKETVSHLNYILIPGDTITIAATGGNYARRLTVRILNANGETVLDQSSTTTGSAGLSKSYSYQIPANATGVYTINVYAANSTTAGDDAQWISASAKIMVKSPEEEVQLLSKSEFKNRVAEMAVANYASSKVLPSIVTAQAIVETAWGQSKIMMKYNALFAVKATKGWTGGYYSTSTKEYYSEWTTVTALFRAYDSWQDALDDHTVVLSQSNFTGAIGGTNYKTVAQILQDGVYATDPNYASILVSIIESNKLYEYDKQAGIDSYTITNGSNDSDKLVKWPSGMSIRTGYSSTEYYSKLLKVELTGNKRTDTYNIANSQVGYSVGKTNTYNYWIAGSDVSQDWCAAFQSWCVRICLQDNGAGNSSVLHYTAGASPTKDSNGNLYFGLTSSTYTWKQYVNGSYGYVPQKGDLVFFGNYKDGAYYGKSKSDGFTVRIGSSDTTPCSHVAMVESVTKNSDGTYTMVAIEGNYGGAVSKTTLKYNSNGEQLKSDGSIEYKRAITYFAVPNY